MKKRISVKKLGAMFLSVVMLLLIAVPSISAANARQNDYPIVLCHGYRGWGRDENKDLLFNSSGKYYWGGNVDLQEIMNGAGYTTYTAAVGPYSSNYDRACELYANILGIKADYGIAHSKKFGHERYGKDYSGKALYPEWGTLNAEGKIKKIHLLAHSQGGPTVRTLVQLLAEGSAEERAIYEAEMAKFRNGQISVEPTISPLFLGGKSSWVHSLTTLASPHNGTTAADLELLASAVEDMNMFKGTLLTAFPGSEAIIDYKLDQWGIKRQPGESILKYLERALTSGIWRSKDSALYDLQTNGSVQLNKWVKAQPDVYYFSWAARGTKPTLLGTHVPDLEIMSDKGKDNLMWQTQATAMGAYFRLDYRYEIPLIGKDWWPNDGYVPTISQNGPKWGSKDVIVDYNVTPQLGKWNFFGTKYMDHEDIIGRHWDIAGFYLDTAKMLSELPVNQ